MHKHGLIAANDFFRHQRSRRENKAEDALVVSPQGVSHAVFKPGFLLSAISNNDALKCRVKNDSRVKL